MKTAVISMLALVVVTAFGSYYQSAVVPYMVIGTICAVAVLVALGKIKPRQYPIYIYGLSLALLWQTSMLGSYIVGTDIHGELFTANRAIVQGWDLGYADPYNTSVVIGGLVPALAKLGFAPVWQFKLLYPAMFACVPLILYFAYRKMVGEKRAFWASLFFMVVPVFFTEVIGIVKSMVAEVFLAVMVLLMAIDIRVWKKAVGIGVCVVMAVLCHYTIGVLAIMFLVGSLIILAVTKPVPFGWLKDRHMPLWVSSVVLVCTLLVGAVWFNFTAQGLMMDYCKNITAGLVGLVSIKSEQPPPSDAAQDEPPAVVVVPEEPSADGVPPSADEVAVPEAETPSTPSYLYKQEPLVQTAIGLDFAQASPSGKVFRVVQYLTQLLLVLGFAYVLFRHRRYKFTAEFNSCVLAGWGLLAMCIFFPAFSTIINASRFYQISLFFLAPMLVVGVEELTRDIGRGVGWVRRWQKAF